MTDSNQKRIQAIGMLVAAISLSIGVAAVNADGFSVQPGTRAEWLINSVSIETVPWYRIDIWTGMGSWKTESGSILAYTVTEANQTVFGELVLGNLTVTNSSSEETASNLILGILMWGPGLITHTNWVKHIEDAQEQTQSEWINGTLEYTETHQTYMGITLETIKFTLVSVSQNTTLVYDKVSGILLEAQTGFGQYYLEIEISLVDPPLSGVPEFLPFPWMILTLPLLSLVGFRIWKRRKEVYH